MGTIQAAHTLRLVVSRSFLVRFLKTVAIVVVLVGALYVTTRFGPGSQDARRARLLAADQVLATEMVGVVPDGPVLKTVAGESHFFIADEWGNSAERWYTTTRPAKDAILVVRDNAIAAGWTVSEPHSAAQSWLVGRKQFDGFGGGLQIWAGSDFRDPTVTDVRITLNIGKYYDDEPPRFPTTSAAAMVKTATAV